MARKINPKTKAYLRVSTEQQDLEKFKPAIFEFASSKGFRVTDRDIISEKISGKVNWRKRRLGELVDSLVKGDRLIIPELSRFSRSMTELLEILKTLKEKRVNVYVLKGSLYLNGDIGDPVTDLIVRILSALSEFERDLMSVRIKEGLKARQDKGIKLGRPKGPGKSKLDQYNEEIIAMLKMSVPKKKIARKYKANPATLHNWINQNKITVESEI
jgi:DNA invertase Pin-like site-specific DNA recombinase